MIQMCAINLSDPYMTVTTQQLKSKEEAKEILLALKKFAEEGLNFVVYTHDTRKEIIIAGKGEKDLHELISRFRDEFDLEIDALEPQVLYKTSIQETVQSEGRYMRQSGGIHQYGHCWIKLEPKSRDGGFEFTNDIVHDHVIPHEYIPSIRNGIEEMMVRGILGHFPVVDVKVTLLDGSFHSFDSKGMSFKIAAALAFRDGFERANPILLEPIMRVSVTTMKCEISDHLSVLTLLRARNINVKSKNGKNLIEAEIPLKSWMSFRKQSHESNVVMDINVIEFGYYDEVPEYLYESIIQESNLEGANYTDIFSWEKWGKVNEKRYLHDFVESFWEEES
ncbi:hypothetical protein [Paenibacillus illinoisensis]|nr:hypothetical protein [Paenibacillus illinoisensis]